MSSPLAARFKREERLLRAWVGESVFICVDITTIKRATQALAWQRLHRIENSADRRDRLLLVPHALEQNPNVSGTFALIIAYQNRDTNEPT